MFQLRLGGNRICRFPAGLAALNKLEVLDLSSNLIREVPTGIHHMKVKGHATISIQGC